MSTSPRQLGKYILLERLGQGAAGEVWKALSPQLQRYFAIKILHVDLQNDPQFVTRFYRVARSISSLQHLNIVPTHDFQVFPGSNIAYIVMDYVEGQTLAEFIRNTSSAGKIPPPEMILQLFASISAGVEYAHQRGISHRDIKPTNILLNQHNTSRNPMGEPMLTDFGLAEMLIAFPTPEINARFLNPLYISPEQAQGHAGTESSDIYALGVILYELCTGTHPYKGESLQATMALHIGATPAPPALYNPNIPPTLTMVILQSLAKNPARRFPGASFMTTALAGALELPEPDMPNVSEYTIDRMNSPTYISGMPIEGVRFEEKRQETPMTPTSFQGDLAVLYQSNPLPGTEAVANAGQSLGTGSPHSAPNLPAMYSAPPVGLPAAPLPVTPPPAPKSRRKGLLIALSLALIIVLAGAGLATFFALKQNTPVVTANPVVGHAYFLSSGLPNGTTSDELEIDLQNIPNPAEGKSYYAWLLGDAQSEIPSLFLTRLTINQGKVHVVYPGDPQHDNLLANYSRLVITENDANVTPGEPLLDTTTWRYIAAIAQTPDPADTINHYSQLSHLRHLLSGDPILDQLGLSGGLGIWLVRNVEKVQQLAGSAKDYWTSGNADLLRDQLISILDYLDSAAYVGRDVLSANPVIVDQRLVKVALLELDPNQAPPGYLQQIASELSAVISAPGATTDQRNLVSQINTDLGNVTQWLSRVRNDAKQLVNLPGAQLLSQNSLSTLNDMALQARSAYMGQPASSTNNAQDGVTQIYSHLASLASFDITQYKM